MMVRNGGSAGQQLPRRSQLTKRASVKEEENPDRITKAADAVAKKSNVAVDAIYKLVEDGPDIRRSGSGET